MDDNHSLRLNLWNKTLGGGQNTMFMQQNQQNYGNHGGIFNEKEEIFPDFQGRMNHKRHLQDPFDGQHNSKRRLVENLDGLSIGNQFYNNQAPNNSSTLFGTFTKEQLNRPLTDPNKVVIRNIDQFLHDNPDQLDLIGEKIQLDDLRKAGLDKLVVSSGLDIRQAWKRIVSQYKSKDNTDKGVEDLIYRLIWEEYLAKYFSLIKYYNPLRVVWDNYQKWLNRKHFNFGGSNYNGGYVTELDNDGDEMMDFNYRNTSAPDTDPYDFGDVDSEAELARLASKEQSLRNGMSGYGSYYSHDDHWAEQSFNHYHTEPIIEDIDDDDDDVVMED